MSDSEISRRRFVAGVSKAGAGAVAFTIVPMHVLGKGYRAPSDTLNVACIGNQVRQMHIHIVGRSPSDPAWPGVVWGFEEKQPYTEEQVEKIQEAFDDALGAAEDE